MKNILIFILPSMLLFFVNCNSKNCSLEIPANLRKLSSDELIERSRYRNFPNISEIDYVNECGEIITRDSLVKSMNLDSLAFDDYIDEDGIVRLTLYRETTKYDKEIEEKARIAYDEGPNITSLPIDCDSTFIILDEVLLRDQNNRKSYEEYSGRNDFINLSIVLGIFDNCNFNDLQNMSREDYSTIWLVIQHSPLRYQEKYLVDLKKLAKSRKISIKDVYMLEDRILMSKGMPQIYGTQVGENDITGEPELYEVIDSAGLDERRRIAGFEPINEYLEYWGIKFHY